jgi:hypothetical protein
LHCPIFPLKSRCSDLHCPMFPLISSITQQQQRHSVAVPLQATKQPTHPPSKNPPSKNLASSFNDSFISSGKQEGGTTFLGEGCDTVTRETCAPTSLNINNLGKAVVIHFVLRSLLWLGQCQIQPVDH